MLLEGTWRILRRTRSVLWGGSATVCSEASQPPNRYSAARGRAQGMAEREVAAVTGGLGLESEEEEEEQMEFFDDDPNEAVLGGQRHPTRATMSSTRRPTERRRRRGGGRGCWKGRGKGRRDGLRRGGGRETRRF